MPAECLPTSVKRGKLSYTIDNMPKSTAKVEVLLKKQAFRIVKISVLDPKGNLSGLLCVKCSYKFLNSKSKFHFHKNFKQILLASQDNRWSHL